MIHTECGLLLYLTKNTISELGFITLLNNLQHRGREAYGIASINDSKINVSRYIDVIKTSNHNSIRSNYFLGHTRYATSGNKSTTDLIQPISIDVPNNSIYNKEATLKTPIIFAFNGNIRLELWKLLYDKIVKQLEKEIETDTDTALINNLSKLQDSELNDTQKMKIYIEYLLSIGDNLDTISKKILKNIKTAYCLILSTLNNTWIIRDSLGNRPLSIFTKIHNPNYLLISSETNIFPTNYLSPLSQEWQSIKPNKIMKITHIPNQDIEYKFIDLDRKHIPIEYNDTTITSNNNLIMEEQKFCLFEKIYFMNSKSYLTDFSQSIKSYRYHLAQLLVEQILNSNDGSLINKMVTNMPSYLRDTKSRISQIKLVGIPETGIEYSNAIGHILKLNQCNIITKKPNYNLRTFICGSNTTRYQACIDKYNIDVRHIPNNIIILVDDSIVRGNTLYYLISYIRKFKPKEIHVLIPSPPVAFPCYYGVDIPTSNELIINKYESIDEVRVALNVDTLTYLDIENIKRKDKSICTHCFDGNDIVDF